MDLAIEGHCALVTGASRGLPISLGACRLFPGSVFRGGTWHVAHCNDTSDDWHS